MFPYDSDHWTSQASAEKGKEIKLPGYWLSNFTKICVTMDFTSRDPRHATILVNYTAQSLYSALHEGSKQTWYAADESTTNAPPVIDKKCLIYGFNMRGPHPWKIKSRVGLESQPAFWCHLPYLVRGVGIGFQGNRKISCGDVIVRNSITKTIETYPAFCKMYIQ